MLRNTAFLLSLLLLSLCLQAQETITVMQYNLLEYGNYNSGWASCYESNNNTQEKDENIRMILDMVKPDILTVNEFGATQAIQDNFIRHNLNINGVTSWKSDNIVNYAGSNIINHIFYNSDKMELARHAVIRTSLRDIDAYELYFKTQGLVAHDTIRLVCMVAHLKAGDSPDDQSKRRAMIQNAMYFIEENYPNDNVLIMGDMNIYSNTEPAYRLMTYSYPNSDILFVDPLSLVGGVGYWDNNGSFAPFHTQSTTSNNSNPCRSAGGLDSRFDMILMSDEIYMGFNRVKYIGDSYHAVGNDGAHFNRSINQGANGVVSADIANALYAVSDHLPVVMKLAVYANLDVEETCPASFLITPNPAAERVSLSGADMDEVRVYNTLGQLLYAAPGHGASRLEVDLSHFAPGVYLVTVIAHGQVMNQKMIKQ